MASYPKRLIEVDLPIARISAHARQERLVKKGRLKHLHMWWAERPLAACRAVVCATLWPDPEDLTTWLIDAEAMGTKGPMGPESLAPRGCKPDEGVPIRPTRFLEEARKRMTDWATRQASKASSGSFARQVAIQKDRAVLNDPVFLRRVLLDFIADFADWNNSADADYLATARALTQAAHEALGGEPKTRPLVVDPFAGRGSIPFEALRIGADAFACDLNPVAVLLNKVALEYIPRFGRKLADRVRDLGQCISVRAAKELSAYYPKDPNGGRPIVYLWARTLPCEGPACGVNIPLLSRQQVTKRHDPPIRTVLDFDGREIRIMVREAKKGESIPEGTARGGKVTCPICNHTIPANRYRLAARAGKLGERMYAVVVQDRDGRGRSYREPNVTELLAFEAAQKRLQESNPPWFPTFSKVPVEPLSQDEPRRLNVLQYGFERWDQLFNARQKLAILTLGTLVSETYGELSQHQEDPLLAEAIGVILALTVSGCLHYLTNMSAYLSDGMVSAFIQSSSIAMKADYAEANPLMDDLVGGFGFQLQRAVEVIDNLSNAATGSATVMQAAAQELVLPEDSAHAIITDPPYYHSIPYADLSDMFYVWLKRFLSPIKLSFLDHVTTPKAEEATQSLPHSKSPSKKDARHYENAIRESMQAARSVLRPDGVSLVVFAHASTAGWEALIKGLTSAGWQTTASWPIDTENTFRMLASRQRTLSSSVHLVGRPREGPDGSLRTEDSGQWREILSELPQRIHSWMPRLTAEGVVGADAIFACLGPALEIFSRYSRAEKASGEVVLLGEYLEHVWAAVAKEALSLLFKDADAASLEPDARLTAMWLWTLGAENGERGIGNGKGTKARTHAEPEEEENEETARDDGGDDGEGGGKKPVVGFVLEFDAARKIAQGLGADLDKLPTVVEVKGDKARLLAVAERTKYLFGKDSQSPEARGRARKKKPQQLSLFEELDEAESAGAGAWGEVSGPKPGQSVLDRIHQSMILFAAGRGEALKRFLVEDAAGKDSRFWKLAQSLSALYPTGTDEKRWVDGVLARKKGLGL